MKGIPLNFKAINPALTCILLLSTASASVSSRPITADDTEEFSAKINIAARDVMESRASGNKPQVIFSKTGGSVPLADLIPEDTAENAEYIAEKTRNDQIVESFKTGQITSEQYKEQMIREMFPVKSNLRPQKVMVRHQVISEAAASTISIPVAVIGSDEYSLSWFKANLGEIRRLNAFVLVTEVKTIQDYSMIQGYASDVKMQPSTADGFLRGLGISYYPILITPQGAFQ